MSNVSQSFHSTVNMAIASDSTLRQPQENLKINLERRTGTEDAKNHSPMLARSLRNSAGNWTAENPGTGPGAPGTACPWSRPPNSSPLDILSLRFVTEETVFFKNSFLKNLLHSVRYCVRIYA